MRPVSFSLLVMVGAAGIALGACAHSELRPPRDLGKRQVVERSPRDRPKWLGTPYREKGNFLYFSGHVAGVADEGLGVRQAKAAAVQNLIEAIRLKARSEFSEAVRGGNASPGEVSRYLDSVVSWTTESVSVSGVVPIEQYTEKVRERTLDGVSYSYNCHVWLRLPREEYFRARQQAAERATEEARSEEARRLAEEVLRKLEQDR